MTGVLPGPGVPSGGDPATSGGKRAGDGDGDGDGDGGAEGAEGAGWQRVHPLTPLISSWQAVVAVLVVVGQQGIDGIARDGGVWSGLRDLLGWAGGSQVAPALLAGALGLVALVVAGATASWRATRFRVTSQSLELRHGVIFRAHRQARLDRLQAVDVSQPLLARIVGLARLTLEVAGGGDSKIRIGYLTESRAQHLRAHLLAAAAGLEFVPGDAPAAQEEPVLEVPLGRLLGTQVMGGAVMWSLVFAALSVVAFVVTGEVMVLGTLLPMLAGSFSIVWSGVSGQFGFRLASSPDGVRVRRGLTEQRSQTVPPGRVQAVLVSQPLLWRPFGWYRVDVNIAGYGKAIGKEGATDTQESVLLPVGTRDDVLTTLALLVPEPGFAVDESPTEVLTAALEAPTAPPGFVGAPRAARWLDPLGWRRCGYRVTDRLIMLRRGRVHRRVFLVPHARIQSVGLADGPLRRRLGLASVALHSTPGRVVPVLRHLAVADARALFTTVVAVGRQARTHDLPHRWMVGDD